MGSRGRSAKHLEMLAQALHNEGYLDLQGAFIDGSFAPAKPGGACVGKTKRGNESKITAIGDRQGLPVAVHVESATPHEFTLVHATSAGNSRAAAAARLIGWEPSGAGPARKTRRTGRVGRGQECRDARGRRRVKRIGDPRADWRIPSHRSPGVPHGRVRRGRVRNGPARC